ncbi:unnamed protein product [Enterobius vermicularis]|uniref:tRNA (cytosine(34)-C(5))-methyltransferase n=1 Tax=Enterobius vermicularis TaxID=51028 RepID=A0A0N4V9N3_ENTVE|nr:unnamed protein product [Enterobius vermicularis]
MLRLFQTSKISRIQFNAPNLSSETIHNSGVRQNYVLREIQKFSERFSEYYKHQGIVKSEEWDAFLTSLGSDLPIAFRVRGSDKDAKTLIDIMNKRYLALLVDSGDSNVHLPKQLPWYPFAFQMGMSRSSVRSCPSLKNFHNFLVTEAEIGNISRQETVSMIPPLLLDVQAHHRVLDVCAAPGSKTVQIIEKMHENGGIPDGIVVANDADNSRCYLLVRQALRRMPTSNCIVINEDAACLPNFFTDKFMIFDRVLCDVVCSGDGTLRKSPNLWGNSLHKLQISIARRALQLLAVGGLMVYSTCSFNPIEDEAVVAELLRAFEGTVELVDVSSKLPGLKRSPGLTSWKVIDKNMKIIKSVDDVPQNARSHFVPSFFPPSEQEVKVMNLERRGALEAFTIRFFFSSFRILPHTQDTGGFFVAISRFSPTGKTTPAKRPLFMEDPFIFLEKDDDRWKNIAEHYGISGSFPYENLLGRIADTDRKRTLYFVNDAVKNFLEFNQGRVKVINAGIKMFGRVEHKFQQCNFRLAQDGLHTIFPFVKKRIMSIDLDDMCRLLKPEDGNENVPRSKLKCGEALQSFTVVCAWMGANFVTPYISKEERVHVLRMLGEDTSELGLFFFLYKMLLLHYQKFTFKKLLELSFHKLF